jgi:tRNA G26 N,N-dimethylase Trm1
MSGGSFDYAFSHIENFADALERKLDPEADGYYDHEFSPEVIAEMRRVITEARKFGHVMHAVEWLWSGDTGEAAFLRRMMDIELDNFVTD